MEKLREKQRNLADEDNFCIPELLVSYGFSIREKPETNFLEFCSSVYSSCCSVEDQLAIYNSWIIQEEKKTLEKKFEWVKGIYKGLLDKLE